MSGSMLWHDTRLDGTAPPHLANNVYKVNGSTPLINSIGWIHDYARSRGGLDDLFVMAHGIEDPYDNVSQRTSAAFIGACGIHICREGLNLANVTLTRRWNSSSGRLISRITLFSCAPALTTGHTRGTASDGERFCMELAAHSGAEVIASTESQRYDTRGPKRVIDFGQWEGNVYRFHPDGTRDRIQ